MHRHRLKGNRHPLLTLCTTCPSCLLTADLNDAVGGICQSRPGLVHMPFLKAAVVSGLNLKRTLADVHERNQSVFAPHRESRLSFKARAPRSALCLLEKKKKKICLRDCRATNWLNQMFSSFCLQARVKFWCVYGFTQRRAVFACVWVRQGFISFCFSYLCMGSAYYIAISVKSMRVCTQEAQCSSSHQTKGPWHSNLWHTGKRPHKLPCLYFCVDMLWIHWPVHIFVF